MTRVSSAARLRAVFDSPVEEWTPEWPSTSFRVKHIASVWESALNGTRPFQPRVASSMVNLYTKAFTMAAEKTVSMSFRVSPKFKALLDVAAAGENRSLTNMLETLVFAHCQQRGLSVRRPR